MTDIKKSKEDRGLFVSNLSIITLMSSGYIAGEFPPQSLAGIKVAFRACTVLLNRLF